MKKYIVPIGIYFLFCVAVICVLAMLIRRDIDKKEKIEPSKETIRIVVFSTDRIKTITVNKTICKTDLAEQLIDTISLQVDSVESMTIIPQVDTFQSVLVKEIYIDTLKINTPWGWNCATDKNVDFLPDGIFIMNYNSYLVFQKP